MTRTTWCLLLVLLCGRAFAEPIRGITLSTHTNGSDWAGDGVRPALEDMRAVGAGWVAIHPYAAVARDGAVRFWRSEEERPPWLDRPIREAHDLGLRVLIKPHLAYWGSGFRWRGEIVFDTEEAWKRFWNEYRQWILDLARTCPDADGFVVGTELDRTLGYEAEWRGIIDAIRAVTDAPLTYAANWSDYRDVPFWDALDAIGIQAYFPLTTEEAVPDSATIAAGWAARMRELRAFADSVGRPVVFTELGYNRSFSAPHEPWAYRLDGPEAEEIQRLCLRIALEAVEREPAVAGVFLWKWFPEPHPVGRNFQLATPVLKRTIASVWRRTESSGSGD